MAQTVTLDGLRTQYVHSLYGRKLGLGYGTPYTITTGGTTAVDGTFQERSPDFLLGLKGVRVPVNTISSGSTVPDQIPNHGIVLLTCTTTAGTTYHGVMAPVPGNQVTIINTSTGYAKVWLNMSGYTTGTVGLSWVNTAAGATGLSTGTQINLPVPGAAVTLTGLTTALWLVQGLNGSSLTSYGSSII